MKKTNKQLADEIRFDNYKMTEEEQLELDQSIYESKKEWNFYRKLRMNLDGLIFITIILSFFTTFFLLIASLALFVVRREVDYREWRKKNFYENLSEPIDKYRRRMSDAIESGMLDDDNYFDDI